LTENIFDLTSWGCKYKKGVKKGKAYAKWEKEENKKDKKT